MGQNLIDTLSPAVIEANWELYVIDCDRSNVNPSLSDFDIWLTERFYD